MNDMAEMGEEKASFIYSRTGLSSSLIEHFANARRQRSLLSFTRGLTSHVYRIDNVDKIKQEDDNNNHVEYCLKRVVEEDEMAPHSIQREILCYSFIDEEQRRRGIALPIACLMAAFRDESDPFSVEIDIILPFYPCTLEEIMDEPLLQFDPININNTDSTISRPSLLIVQQIRCSSLEAFIKRTTKDLFAALSFLHSCHIAHRDIKPSNILIDAKSLSIILIDFGTCHLPSFAPGDDRKGNMTSEVGTGAYRAPESLFTPLNGYKADKVDIWQAGVTLVQFFLPLKKVEVRKESTEKLQDDRQEWEKALWADDGGLSWSQLEADSERNAFAIVEEKESSLSGWKREMLFDSSRGDIGLANSIFELKGLPISVTEWPEAEFFQPSLQKMPFMRRPAALLQQRINKNTPIVLFPIIDIIDQCIQLSSSNRISADDIIKQL